MKNYETKERMRLSGVYRIKNTVNEKSYIGSAVKFSRRFWQHRIALRDGTHRNSLLQRAWSKYGEDAFLFSILEVTLPEHAVATEQVMMDYYRAAYRDYGYNICHIAGSTRGVVHSAAFRAKISAASKNMSLETREKIAIAARNRSAETLEKIASFQRGRARSPETRAKIAMAARNISNETRLKRSASMSGRKISVEQLAIRRANQKPRPPASQETRNKLSEAGMGRRHTPEAKAKCSAAKKGKPLSIEHRAKLSAARRGREWKESSKASGAATRLRKKLLKASGKLVVL